MLVRSLRFGNLVLAAGAFGAWLVLHACGSSSSNGTPTPEQDTGPIVDAPVDAPHDSNVGSKPTCPMSPTAAPFPSGTCSAPKPAKPDAFDEALSKVGLDRCKFALDPLQVPHSGWNIKDPRRLPDYEPLVLDPLRLPAYGSETAKWLDDALASPSPISSAIVAAAQRRGGPIADCPSPDWWTVDGDDPHPLASVVAEIARASGADFDLPGAIAATQTIPLDFQRALVPLVRAIGYGSADVVAARKTTDGPTLDQLSRMPQWVRGALELNLTKPFLASLDAWDVTAITKSAAAIAAAIETAKLDRFANVDVSLELDTPFGAIVLHGAGADAYDPGSKADGAALVIDTGGDDTWHVPAGASSLALPISIAIDLGGADHYGYVEKKVSDDAAGTRLPSDGAGRYAPPYQVTRSRVARQGAGILGVGMLVDLGKGKDHYQSLALSQGVGVLGVGVLYDDGGDDTYACEAYSQGAAGWGVGLLLDVAGDDSYSSYTQSQGLGNTQGFGALVDEAGADAYYVNPGDPTLPKGDPIYYSPQLPDKGNTSMSQGCGQGRRFDTTKEGIGFLGGMGVLRDAGNGKDTYTTSVFGQACGFQGAGFLLDGGGDDTYEGFWYVQGADAHLGIAYFNDRGGNDKYNPTFRVAATSIGVGHDFSVAVHYDEAGDDAYVAPGLSLGSGYDNGIGLLVNVGGTDTFAAPADRTLGSASVDTGIAATGRLYDQTLGAFVKASGSATYTLSGSVDASRVGGTWSFAPEDTPDGGVADSGKPVASEKSIGVDRPSGTASLP